LLAFKYLSVLVQALAIELEESLIVRVVSNKHPCAFLVPRAHTRITHTHIHTHTHTLSLSLSLTVFPSLSISRSLFVALYAQVAFASQLQAAAAPAPKSPYAPAGPMLPSLSSVVPVPTRTHADGSRTLYFEALQLHPMRCVRRAPACAM
jgi:hypothetical protein